MKLPSRNWLIFLSITGSFFGALVYDRREKNRVQQKWSNLVAHLANDPLNTNETRRKITIFLSAPPGDGLRSAREHFREYVKPILVSGAMDYEVIEGRREGDVRAALAEKIRKSRQVAGEGSGSAQEDEESEEGRLRMLRRMSGVHDEPAAKGDLVIGRNTWKEYMRGLHEGWLGPLSDPYVTAVETSTPAEPAVGDNASHGDGSPTAQEGDQPAEQQEENKEPEQQKEPEKKKPTGPPPSFLLPSAYDSQPLPPSIPHEFPASVPVAHPHILGFLKTPIRVYRFLTRRYLADSVGQDVAALVLASSTRPYKDTPPSPSESTTSSPESSNTSTSDESPSPKNHEQQWILEPEEKEWHKSVHKESENPDVKEREWLDDVVLDPRIGSRMQRFILSPDDEARSQRIGEGKEWVMGEEKPPYVSIWKQLWKEYGWAEEESKVIIGNLDGEDGE